MKTTTSVLKRNLMDAVSILFSRYIRQAPYTHGALKIEQILHNRFWEWYYKVDTYGVVDSALEDGVRYEPTPYVLLQEALNRIELGSEDVYADLGCGKGRSMVLAAKRNLKRVIGVEYDATLLDIARKNIEQLGVVSPQVVYHNCLAQVFDYTEVTRIFMYNPFGAESMQEVLGVIEQSLASHPRDLRIAYINPQHDYLFEKASWLEQFDLWEEKMYPAFLIHPYQPKAATFWRVK